jgi:tRNA/tmRNA/rRNA uracil-C5-methylase (TrmA/RlmC/RlmD family)
MNAKPNWLGKTFELNIEKVAHGGIFVARHEGRVVFVSHVLPGERVKARVFEDRGASFCRAEPTEILEASPDRVPQVWKDAGVGKAGGCEFGHIKLARQRQLKADVITEALQRMAGVDMAVTVEAAPGDDESNGLGYRTRVQLHVDEAGTVGPFRERSHEVVKVKSLPLAVEDIQELEFQNKNYQSVENIEIAASSSGQIQWKIDGKLKGDERLIERVAGRTFRISGGGFWQVHRAAPQVLTSAVLEMVAAVGIDKTADNLDLYGGVGLFASTMAGRFGNDLRISSVESFRQATDDATLNLSDLPNAKAFCASVERFLNEKASAGAKPTATVVLDPPRAGAGAKVIDRLLTISPKHIVYVACDPIALARDLKQLLAGGYKIAALRAFDLFAHTHHVETIVSLVK